MDVTWHSSNVHGIVTVVLVFSVASAVDVWAISDDSSMLLEDVVVTEPVDEELV